MDTLFLMQTLQDFQNLGKDIQDIGTELLKTFKKSGTTPDGSESLSLHSAVFSQVFLCGLTRKLGCSTNTSDGGNLPKISATTYFSILCTDGMGWLTFFDGIVPSLPLTTIMSVLSSMSKFIDEAKDKIPAVSLVKLLVSFISVLHTVVLNLTAQRLKVQEQNKDTQNSLGVQYRCPKEYDKMKSDLDSFGTIAKNGLERLLEILNSEICHLVDAESFRKTLHALLFHFCLIDPFLSEQTFISNSFKWLKTSSTATRETSNKKTIPNGNRLNKKSPRVEDGFEMVMVDLNSLTLNNPKSGDGVLIGGVDLQEIAGQDESTKEQNINESGDCVHTVETLNLVIDTIRSKVPRKLFIDLARFLASGSFYDVKSLYKVLTQDLVVEKNLTVGLHTLGHEFLVDVFNRLFHLTHDKDHTGCVNVNESARELQLIDCVLLDKFQCNKYVGKAATVDNIVKSGRILNGQEDLFMIQQAAKKRQKGFLDLMAVGMLNTDICDWWEAGFYDLVLENAALLATEDNVHHVLKVVLTSRLNEKDGTGFLVRMEKLFQLMFRQLPALIQDRVIYQVLSGHISYTSPLETSSGPLKHGGALFQHKSEAALFSELTSHLNKLTLANADETLPDFLLLCLHGPKTIMRHLMLRAVESNGQVPAVIQVLRGMPSMCSLVQQDDNLTICCLALKEVFTKKNLEKEKWKSLQQLISSLTKPYSCKEELSLTVVKDQSTILSIVTVMNAIIVPILNKWLHGRNVTTPGQDSTNLETDVQKDNFGMSNDSFEVSNQLMSLTLKILNSVISETNSENFSKLEPLVILTIAADIYVYHFDVMSDEEVDKEKLEIKGASCRCLDVLNDRLSFIQFSEKQTKWLSVRCLQKSWLHMALLSSALPTWMHSKLRSLCSRMVERVCKETGTGLQELCLLVQMSMCSDPILQHVKQAISAANVVFRQSHLITLVGHFLQMSLVSEMPYLVEIMLEIVTIKETKQETDCVIDKDISNKKEVMSRQHTCVLFTQSVLKCLPQMSDSTAAHVLANFQAALKHLIPSSMKEPALMTTCLYNCLLLLSLVHGQGALLLQVSALDYITQLLTFASAQTSTTRNMTKDMGSSKIDPYEISNICKSIQLIQDDSIRKSLLKKSEKLKNLTKEVVAD